MDDGMAVTRGTDHRLPDRLEWIEDQDRWMALADTWDVLAELDPTPFSLHAWISAWWAAFGAGRTLAVCALWRGDELVAALPMSDGPGGAAPLANVHTPQFTVLARDAAARDAVLAAGLARASGNVLLVPGLADGDPTLAALTDAARASGRPLLLEPGELAPYIDTGGDWAAYRAAMKSKWGSVERKERKMIREQAGRLLLVEPPDDLDRQLDEGFRVEASGWKGAGGTAIASRPETAAFYRAVAHAFAARGELRLSGISFGDQAVAFDLAILRGRRLYVLKTGYDEQFAQLSPGLVLRRAVTERCFELGLETQELLGDDLPWKRRFATGDRPHRVARIYPRRPGPLAEYSYRKVLRPIMRKAYDRSPRLRAAYQRLRKGGVVVHD
jgi:CelD/BcsL family acetyltransferase involved in cellulose biosynthesis